MLPGANHTVVGSCDLEVTSRFLAAFGFETMAEAELTDVAARKLYGQAGPCRERVLIPPGADCGWVRLVETSGSYSPPGSKDPRSLALVVETRDLAESLARASALGAWCGEPSQDTERQVREAAVIGPHRLNVLLRELRGEDGQSRHRSLLDQQGDALHSEVVGVLWSLRSFNLVRAFWAGNAGYEVLEEGSARSRSIGELSNRLELEEELPYMRVADAQGHPVCLELLESFEELGRNRPTWPLASGIHAVAFPVRNIKKRMKDLRSSSAFGEVVAVDSLIHGSGVAVSGRAPGRVRFELWRESSLITMGNTLVN